MRGGRFGVFQSSSLGSHLEVSLPQAVKSSNRHVGPIEAGTEEPRDSPNDTGEDLANSTIFGNNILDIPTLCRLRLGRRDRPLLRGALG